MPPLLCHSIKTSLKDPQKTHLCSFHCFGHIICWISSDLAVGEAALLGNKTKQLMRKLLPAPAGQPGWPCCWWWYILLPPFLGTKVLLSLMPTTTKGFNSCRKIEWPFWWRPKSQHQSVRTFFQRPLLPSVWDCQTSSKHLPSYYGKPAGIWFDVLLG